MALITKFTEVFDIEHPIAQGECSGSDVRSWLRR